MKAVILVEKAELRSEFDKTETALKTVNSGGVFQLIQALVGGESMANRAADTFNRSG